MQTIFKQILCQNLQFTDVEEILRALYIHPFSCLCCCDQYVYLKTQLIIYFRIILNVHYFSLILDHYRNTTY
ncbi:Cysteine--tRNA ligase [Frankliniella fusca]|uniref:Cysteine--tRNA ligase n=1 Tax=Frankliniella fusca TaxID=407009 RepID=A0AAE1GW91_9NEOP|nr:Cysteine--tRNA ligase [Frankliniella fusca]